MIDRIKEAPRYSEESFNLLKILNPYLDQEDMKLFMEEAHEKLAEAKMEDKDGRVAYEANKVCEILKIDPQSVSHLTRKIPLDS